MSGQRLRIRRDNSDLNIEENEYELQDGDGGRTEVDGNYDEYMARGRSSVETRIRNSRLELTTTFNIDHEDR